MTRPVLAHPLHTDRLTLRPATADDADRTWDYRRPASVNEWLTGCPVDLGGYRELFSEPARLATTVIVICGHDPAGPVIGDMMLRREDAWAQLEVSEQARGKHAELGWVLDPIATGNGYATEAVRELIRYCFEDLGVRRVTANCFLANETSWHLMERVGMRRELHAIGESLHRSGHWLDTVGYAVLEHEWSSATTRSPRPPRQNTATGRDVCQDCPSRSMHASRAPAPPASLVGSAWMITDRGEDSSSGHGRCAFACPFPAALTATSSQISRCSSDPVAPTCP